MSYAAARGHTAVITKLINGYADLDALDCVKQTAVHSAAVGGRAEAIDLLAKKRARLEERDAAGRTPLDVAVASRQDAAIRMLIKRGVVMPDDLRALPGMDELTTEVEAEMIREQMAELGSGQAAQEIKAAEKEFEDARQKMLRLTQTIAAAEAAPALQEAELALQDATKLAKDMAHAEGALHGEMGNLADDIERTLKEIKEREKSIDACRANVEELDQIKVRHLKDTEAVRVDIEACRDEYNKALARNGGLVSQITLEQAKIPPLESELAGLRSADELVVEELIRVRAELAQWNAEKEQAHSLHIQAQALLGRHVAVDFKPTLRPTSPSRQAVEGKEPPVE